MPEHTKIAIVTQGLCANYFKRRLVSGEATVWRVKIKSVIRVCQSKQRALRLRILCGAYTKRTLNLFSGSERRTHSLGCNYVTFTVLTSKLTSMFSSSHTIFSSQRSVHRSRFLPKTRLTLETRNLP